MSGANAPYYVNNKADSVDFIEAADLEAIESGFADVDTDKANKAAPTTGGDLAALTAGGDLSDSGKTPPSGEIVGTTDTQTLTNKTFTGLIDTVYTVPAGNPALSGSNGRMQLWTLSGNSTPTDGMSNGETLLLLIDDGSASTITWTSIVDVWETETASAPTLRTTGVTPVILYKANNVVYGATVGSV